MSLLFLRGRPGVTSCLRSGRQFLQCLRPPPPPQLQLISSSSSVTIGGSSHPSSVRPSLASHAHPSLPRPFCMPKDSTTGLQSLWRHSSSSTSNGSGNVNPPATSENVWTVPNALCMSRILLTPYMAYLIVSVQPNYPLALGLFAYAGFTDWLDGYIARRFPSQASNCGTFLDPLADKVLATTLYLSLAYAQLVPVVLTSLVVSRDVFLVYGAVNVRYMGVPPPVTLKKFFDPTFPSAKIHPPYISKVNTLFQFGLISLALAAPIAEMTNHPAFHAACILTGLTTVASAASYAFQTNTFTLLANQSEKNHFNKKMFVFALFIAFNAGFVYLMPRQRKVEAETEQEGGAE